MGKMNGSGVCVKEGAGAVENLLPCGWGFHHDLMFGAMDHVEACTGPAFHAGVDGGGGHDAFVGAKRGVAGDAG